jgi:hypothetical protein
MGKTSRAPSSGSDSSSLITAAQAAAADAAISAADRAYTDSVANQAAEVGYAEIRVSTAAISTAESAHGSDVAGLSVTFTADGATPYVAEFEGTALVVGTGAALQLALVRLIEGAQELQRWVGTPDFNGTAARAVHRRLRWVPTAGQHTVKINAAVAGATSITLQCDNATGNGSGVNPEGKQNYWSLSVRKA